jgi:hypothetical protein
MEATGVYWRPIWAVLEDEFELMLVNARHVKQVPGRKTDMSDAAWLCQVAEAGLLSANFVPPKPIRALRMLTRYRKTQVAERQREANRLHKALEDTGIKLDCVASDILGVSGRAMLDALVAGTTDPVVLAELGKGRLRAKIPALREALEGRFDALHSLLIGAPRAPGFPRRADRLAVRRDRGAACPTIICACWHMLTTGETYRELGEVFLARRNSKQATRRLVAQLERLGHTVTIQEATAA